MLFNSLHFLFFFAIVYLLYWRLQGRARQLFLVVASIFFYATWGLIREGLPGIRWTVHFAGVVGLNYILIHRIFNDPPRKKLYLIILLIINLINLGTFKYTGFFIHVLFDIGVGLPDHYEGFDFFLPLAISFYTFQLIAYAVDVFRGVIPVDPGPRRFFLFILFFPQLIAGPIMRSTDFMDQIDRPQIDTRRMYDGLWLIVGGLSKKVLLADPAGNFIAPVFQNPEVYDWVSILLAGTGFSLQVYGDFSGYTDLARGSARLLGYEIPENFTAPFFSRSAKELWQRWHITLASWLRDYIYIPLGGSRVGKLRNYLNLIITFTLGGLWHGADYTFLAWGGMWGILLAVERWIEVDLGIKTTPRKNRLLIVAKVIFMFFLFSVGAIMFRSQNVHHSGHNHSSGEIMVSMLSGLFTSGSDMIRNEYTNNGGDAEIIASVFGNSLFDPQIIPNIESLALIFLFMGFFHLIQYRPSLFEKWRKYDPVLLIIVAALMGGYLMPVNISGSHQFIYFVF